METHEVPVNVLNRLVIRTNDQLRHFIKERLGFFRDEDRPSRRQLGQEPVIQLYKESNLRNIQISIAILVRSCKVVPDFDWVEYYDVEVAAGGEHLLNIYQQVVNLCYRLEYSEEALVLRLGLNLGGPVLQCQNSSVDEGDDVVSVEGPVIDDVHELGADKPTALINCPIDAPLFGGAPFFMFPAAAALFNDCSMVELPSNWVDQANEALTIYTFHRLPNMPNLVPRSTCHVSTFHLNIVETEQSDQRNGKCLNEFHL